MESIKVKDLMVPVDTYITISEDATIYEAVASLRRRFRNMRLRAVHSGRFWFVTNKETSRVNWGKSTF